MLATQPKMKKDTDHDNSTGMHSINIVGLHLRRSRAWTQPCLSCTTTRTNNIASNGAMRCSTPTRKGLTYLAAKSPARQASPTTKLIGANDLTPHSLLYVETNNAPVSGNRGRAAESAAVAWTQYRCLNQPRQPLAMARGLHVRSYYGMAMP